MDYACMAMGGRLSLALLRRLDSSFPANSSAVEVQQHSCVREEGPSETTASKLWEAAENNA